MSLTQDNIDGFRTTLLATTMSIGQVEIAVALMEMLNKVDPSLWNFENCERLIAKLVTEIATNGTQNINEIMINIANEANAPVGSDTILKVEWYRKIFLYLLGIGVSFLTLQAMVPDAISFVLDSTYALFQELLKSNYSHQQIAQHAVTTASASPLSPGSMAQAIVVSSTNLVTAAFYACADVVKTCASAVSQNYADCLRYGTELLSFAVATRVVPPVVEKAAKAVKTVADVASGSADEKIAQWIDEGGPQKVQAAIAAAGADFVDATKAAIGQSIDDMAAINKGLIDPDRAPNRFIGPTINDMINRALGDRVMASAEEYRTAIGELIGDLSEIDFDETEGISDKGNPGVLAIMQKYSIRWDENPGFRALIAVWKLATEKPDKIEETLSQPDPIVNSAVVSLKRADTLKTDRMAFREDPNDPSRTFFETKSTKQIGPQRLFPSLKVEKPVIDKLQKLLDRYNLTNRPFPKGSDFVGKTVYEVVSREEKDVQEALLKVLEEKESRDPSILQLSPLEKKKAIEANKLRYLAAIENFLHPTINIEVSEKEMETDLGGSHRRRKSRHYRKKRSTLKRRGLKRRRTRKGKKRRHTKKRR